jgi:hypothetical protein
MAGRCPNCEHGQMRVNAIIVAGSALAMLTVVAACGGDTSASAPPAKSAVHATTAAPMTAAPTTTVAPTATPVVAPASFRADLTVQRSGLSLLALTNTGQRPVTVRGWPRLAFRNAANETVAVPMRQVDVPGAGPSITIGPGETAFAGLRWVVGDKANPTTFVATSLRLTAPGATTSMNVNIIGADGQTGGYTEFDLTSAQIGTLQPSSQGVLVF